MARMPTDGRQYNPDVTDLAEALTDILFKTGRHAESADDNGHGEGNVDNKGERYVDKRGGR